MFKRVIWMGIGAAAGSAATVWSQKKVKAQVDKVARMATPQHVAEVTKARIGDVRDTVVAAVSEGRSAKRSAESEMRAHLDQRWGRPSVGAATLPPPTPLRRVTT